MTKIPEDVGNSNQLNSKRSLSRLMAVQTLYQYKYHDQNDDILKTMNDVVDNYLIDSNKDEIESYRKKTDINFLQNLVSGVILVLEKIDNKITDALGKGHKFDQIPDVMVQILRLGAFELEFMKDNPFRVIINEYVDIANSFYDQNKVNFVNAVLDKIAKTNK